jgi:hypothetical protein
VDSDATIAINDEEMPSGEHKLVQCPFCVKKVLLLKLQYNRDESCIRRGGGRGRMRRRQRMRRFGGLFCIFNFPLFDIGCVSKYMAVNINHVKKRRFGGLFLFSIELYRTHIHTCIIHSVRSV